jgi:amidase
MGSVRIPSACCGLFGIKPGTGVVPVALGKNDWYGLAQNGALATSVDDAALLLDVVAGRTEFRDPQPPADPLRIALSTKSPALAGGVDPEFREAVERVGALLEESGHTVDRFDPPYSVKAGPAAFLRWTGGVASDAEELDLRRLEARNRRHAAIGRIAEKRGWVGVAGRDRWRAALEPMFGRFDLLITPALARPPIEAKEWWKKSWLANIASNARFAPMAAPWNLADFPAASIPAGMHSARTPLAIQLVAPLGGEGRILSLAKQIEELSPWPRHAPLAGVPNA